MTTRISISISATNYESLLHQAQELEMSVEDVLEVFVEHYITNSSVFPSSTNWRDFHIVGLNLADGRSNLVVEFHFAERELEPKLMPAAAHTAYSEDEWNPTQRLPLMIRRKKKVEAPLVYDQPFPLY